MRHLIAFTWFAAVALTHFWAALALVSHFPVPSPPTMMHWTALTVFSSLGQGLLALTAHYWATAADNRWGGLKGKNLTFCILGIVLFSELGSALPRTFGTGILDFAEPYAFIVLLLFQRWFVP